MAENNFESDQVAIDTGSEKWYGQQVGTTSDPIIDPNLGSPYVIREFTFGFNPEVMEKIKNGKLPKLSQQELFNTNWKQIQVMLWGDGLVAIQDEVFPPRVIIGKSQYKIILVCQPKQGVIVADKIKGLNQYLLKKR